MEFILAVALTLVVLAISCYSDLRERRIPDWLTYAGTAVGVIIWLFAGNFYVLPYVVCTFFAAYFLYRLGLWAGGDVKLFTAIAALNPHFVDVFGYSIPLIALIFLLSILLAFFLSFPLMLAVILTRKELRGHILSGAPHIAAKAFSVSVLTHCFGLFGLLFVFLPSPADLFASLAVLFWRPALDFLLSFTLILAISLFLRVVSMRVLVFRKEKAVGDLQEGDVPADFITEDGKIIPFSWRTAVLAEIGKIPVRLSPLRAAGLYEEDIEWLRSKGIHNLSIRTTMPFVPFVAMAYLFSLAPIFFGG